MNNQSVRLRQRHARHRVSSADARGKKHKKPIRSVNHAVQWSRASPERVRLRGFCEGTTSAGYSWQD